MTEDGEACTKEDVFLDENLIREEEKYDGFYAVCTNLENKSVSEIVRINKKRWEIEECFRIMKTEFRARPVYLRKEDRIKAHFLTCYIALMVYRILEKKLEEICKAPKAGRPVHNPYLKRDDVRRVLVKNYIAYYLID
jgi:transposase